MKRNRSSRPAPPSQKPGQAQKPRQVIAPVSPIAPVPLVIPQIVVPPAAETTASPHDAEVLNQLQAALAAYQREEYDRAWAHCQQALQRDGNRPDSWTMAGMIHRKAGRVAEAIEAYRRAIAVQPLFADSYNNLGNLLLRDQNKPEEAIDCYRRAIEIKPDSVDAHYNMGGALQELCRIEEAVASFQRAVALRPDYADGHWDLALALLLMGHYEQGWSEYEWRWRRGEPAPRPFAEPAWDGAPLKGRRILLYVEQGLGDAIQFARYVPLVAAHGGKVILEVREPVLTLLQRVPGVTQMVLQNTPLPPFDCHAPLMTLPYLFGTTLDTIPNRVPYLDVDAERLAYWGGRLRSGDEVRVGLVWGGNIRVKNDAIRSPRLGPLLDLLRVAGVTFYVLQQGDGRNDLDRYAPLPESLLDVVADVKDVADTAAVMTHMDLIISSDTVTAHLAGALGLPGWILTPFSPDWRWMLDRSDNPWYPTLRLFRQSQPLQWQQPVDAMRLALEQFVAEWRAFPDRRRRRGAIAVDAEVVQPDTRLVRPIQRPVMSGTAAAAISPALVQQAYQLLTQALNSYNGHDTTTAQQLCQRALEMMPRMAEAWTIKGMIHRRQGQLSDAINAYKRAIEVNSSYADAYANLGNASLDKRDLTQAEQAYRGALSLRADWPEVLSKLSAILRETDRFTEAAAFGRRAVQIKPDFAEAWLHLANALKPLGQVEEAYNCYQKALSLQSVYPEAHYNLGILLQDLERYQEAIGCYQQALAAQNHFPQAWYNLGLAWQKLNDTDQALVCYGKASEQDATHHGAFFNRAGLLNGSGRFEEALVVYRQALAITPDDINIAVEIFHIEQKLCDWSHFDEALLRQQLVLPAVARARVEQGGKGIPASPFPFLSMPTRISGEEHRLLAQAHGRHIQRGIDPLYHHYPDRTLDQRLRIGYFSSDLRNHPIGQLVCGLFKYHDRSRFEVFVYSFGPDDGSSYRQRIQKDSDHFIDVRSWNFRQTAERIRGDRIDILVDLNGYTRDCRLEVLAHRPAPVQATYLGYPGPLGADFVQYVLTDRIVTPPEQQPFYSEKLIYLPHCYQINDNEQPLPDNTPDKVAHGLPEDSFVFCCFNTHYKIDPSVFAVWMDLLRQLPGAVLWLLDAYPLCRDYLRREAVRQGVAAERLVFAPRMGKEQHLARHRWADLCLDTCYYNAHTTASDSLWAGIPLLTCPGESFASRVSASLLHAIGLGDAGLIVPNLEAYRARAIELASQPGQLADLRSRLQHNRLTQPLFDTERSVRGLEAAFQQMWHHWLTGH
ncbi:MAG: tetratricopeptide repeat protein [Magnetococcales bacterium]|nr:tetratricopeptide repeat protein [Magnetococcales bacterium]